MHPAAFDSRVNLPLLYFYFNTKDAVLFVIINLLTEIRSGDKPAIDIVSMNLIGSDIGVVGVQKMPIVFHLISVGCLLNCESTTKIHCIRNLAIC